MQELFTFFSDIEVIEGSLIITHSNSLTSLGFFKKLRIINGGDSRNDPYGLRVFGNKNLRALFPRYVVIKHGHIFFHSNPKLCLNVINKFKNSVVDLKSLQVLPIHEVSPFSNGDEVCCCSLDANGEDCSDLNIYVEKIGPTGATFGVESRSHENKPETHGILLYIRTAPFLNVTRFDDRFACGSNEWLVTDIPYNRHKDDSMPRVIFANSLKHNTQYAYYIRTYTITSAQRINVSPIKYFRTIDLAPNVTHSAMDFELISEIEKNANFNCSSNCKKYCPPGIIESTSTAKPYRGCTHITGSLLINIQKQGGCKYYWFYAFLRLFFTENTRFFSRQHCARTRIEFIGHRSNWRQFIYCSFVPAAFIGILQKITYY